MKTEERINRQRGLLFGLAVGDLIGGPTAMALMLAESLVEKRRFVSEDVFDRWLHWWKEEGFDTGPTADAVFRRVDRDGMKPTEAAVLVHDQQQGKTAGVNPAHRVVPMALADFLDDAQAVQAATEQAELTHHHVLAADTAVGVVLLARKLIDGTPWEDARTQVSETRTREVHSALRARIDDPVSKGGYGPEALQAAVHFVTKSGSFEEAVKESIQFAGPMNYCPPLAGALAGARWGLPEAPYSINDPLKNRLERVLGELTE